MQLKRVFLSACCIIPTLLATAAPGANHALNINFHKFAEKVFPILVHKNERINIVYSPLSIQLCVAMALLGAEGETAREILQAFELPLHHDDNEEIAQAFGEFLQSNINHTRSLQLNMANAIFISDKLEIVPAYRELAQKYLDALVLPLNFENKALSTGIINTWIESKTNGIVKQALTQDSIDSDTSAFLFNTLYFKGTWTLRFDKKYTSRSEFFYSASRSTGVDMMTQTSGFAYAVLRHMDACAVALPYKDKNLVMLIILPNEVEGLLGLEQKLQNVALTDVLAQLRHEIVEVFLPKFSIDYNFQLEPTLKKLGIKKIFSAFADFGGLFGSAGNAISRAQHQAFIDVDEAGTEAAAFTFAKLRIRSEIHPKIFRADHPFFFAILNQDAVFFAGHVAKL